MTIHLPHSSLAFFEAIWFSPFFLPLPWKAYVSLWQLVRSDHVVFLLSLRPIEVIGMYHPHHLYGFLATKTWVGMSMPPIVHVTNLLVMSISCEFCHVWGIPVARQLPVWVRSEGLPRTSRIQRPRRSLCFLLHYKSKDQHITSISKLHISHQ